MEKYGIEYQSSSVNAKACLSYLFITQMVLMNIYLAFILSFVAHRVKSCFHCYVDNGYNKNIELIKCTWVECSGLEIGCVVAILTYILDLFGLLYFHGSVHNVFIKALAYWRSILAQACLSYLFITQMVLMNIYLAFILSFVAHRVKSCFHCYVDNGYNKNIELIKCTWVECSGLEIGCVVAILTYILDLFGLLYFHGSVHNVFIKALAYWRSISAFLAEHSDLVVTGNAIKSSSRYDVNELDFLVEFDSYIVKH
ncbi:hypothetical protein CTEN210_18681 [Chaetoceros tenuissimus]|uniref:Uncharacterized protein n=1 Tax=Chaetoceros tenuissimus TaxID=426638 RepID=A0AAD3DF19_9STRA|nr:hypothetical protein CTEN210_18681 [Chaetoceros tenuissimus]